VSIHREDIVCLYSLNFCHDLTKCVIGSRLKRSEEGAAKILYLRYNFRYTDARYYHCDTSSRIFIKTLSLPPPKHSVPVLYQNKLKRQKRARHFTDGYTVRVYSNSFIEALHVLHETFATNNCFSARACWYFLISETYRPVEMASTIHMFRDTLSATTEGE